MQVKPKVCVEISTAMAMQMTNFAKVETVTPTQTDSHLGIAGGNLDIYSYYYHQYYTSSHQFFKPYHPFHDYFAECKIEFSERANSLAGRSFGGSILPSVHVVRRLLFVIPPTNA